MSDTLCTTCWTFDCEGHAQSDEHIQVNGNLSVLPKGEGVNLTGSLDVCFSDYGQQILEEMMLLQGHPLLLLGDSGWGKSVIAREVGRRCGYAGDTTPVETNAYPNMDISLWMGQWLPSSENGAVSVNWHDGEMTRAIRCGAMFLLEEITRAPQDGLARFFGPTDNGYRYHTLPESSEGRIRQFDHTVKQAQRIVALGLVIGIARGTGGAGGKHRHKACGKDDPDDRHGAILQEDRPLFNDPRSNRRRYPITAGGYCLAGRVRRASVRQDPGRPARRGPTTKMPTTGASERKEKP